MSASDRPGSGPANTVWEISLAPLVRHRRAVIATFLAVAAAVAPGALRLQVDNSPEGFFVEDAHAVARFRQLELDFGRDRAVRLVLTGAGLWTSAGLTWLADLERAAQAPGGVWAAGGVVAHHRWHLERWPPADPAAFHARVTADPFDATAGWVSSDGGTATVLVALYKLTPARRAATLAALEELLSRAPPGITGRIAGLAVVNQALDEAQRRMAFRFLPLLVLVAAALLVVLFRSLTGVVLPLTLVGVCEVVLLGAMGYAGQRLDIVTSLLTPLVMVIALATGVHVLAYHRRLRAAGLDPAAAVLATYRVKAWPVLWTGMTTCVGFASLALSGVPPVRALGLWTAFAIAFLTLAALSLYPALLATPSATGGTARPGLADHVGGWGRRWAAWAVEHRRWVAALFAAAALLAAVGLPRMSIESNILTFFRPTHPLRAEVEDLEARGLGVVAASLVLERPASFDDPTALVRLAGLAAALRREPLAFGVLSAGDLVADVVARSPEPVAGVEPWTAARARVNAIPDLRRFLALLLTGDGTHTRLILMTPVRGFTELEPLYRRAEALAHEAFPEAKAWVTGQYPLVLAAQHSLLRTVVLSLTATFLVIAVVLRLLLGSAALTWRAVVPNLWPVLVVLGSMGWFGVPVDSATVMIAAVVLGLAVDDTLHTLGHLRHVMGGTAGGSQAGQVVDTLAETAAGHVSTSTILVLGFGVCGLSSLLPVARFGALSSLAIAAALAADLLLVPALLASAPAAAIQRFVRATGVRPADGGAGAARPTQAGVPPKG